MKEEVRLMKGNEAIAHAAIRYGFDGYFGYPITPQSEVLETLEELMPWETTGMTVLQAESELAAINMVYGGASSGKAVMTSSSSPGVSLKQEGISYIAAAELPALILNVMRGGPGRSGHHPALAGRLFSGRQGWRPRRLSPDCPGPRHRSGNGGLRGPRHGFGLQVHQPRHDSRRRYRRPDDGEGSPARTASPPHRGGNPQAVPLGRQWPQGSPQAQRSNLS